MADAGTAYTDSAVRAMERRFRSIYRQAQEEIIGKLDEHTKALNALDEVNRAKVENGELSPAKYRQWLNEEVFKGKQWKDKVDSVATSLLYANQQANDIIEGKKRAVFGENATFQAFKMEHDAGMDLSFSIYDSATVTRLIKESPELLPRKVVNGAKDKAWNRTKISNCVTQGIIQGESIPQIAERIAKSVTSDNMSAMTRYARTAMTGAQNAGRMEMLHEAQGMGIKVKKKWLATLDARTRDAHAELDGQEQDVDKPFRSALGNIDYPGDFHAHPANTWNCRCTLIYVYPEYPAENAQRRAKNEETGEWEKISDMTYSEWKGWKQNIEKEIEQIGSISHKIVEGVDISETWKRREDMFQFEIQDVLNAQGYDGVPRVVGQEEFEKAVSESKFIAQRTYSAPSKEALDAYRDQLYNGEWYVDCSTGGAQYGQGMYVAADYSGQLTDGIRNEMSHYKELNVTRGNPYSYVETLTLSKDAKVITYDDAKTLFNAYSTQGKFNYSRMKAEAQSRVLKAMGVTNAKDYDELLHLYRYGTTKKQIGQFETLMKKMGVTIKDVGAVEKKINDEFKILGQDRITNIGSYMASLGYDAINAEGHGESGSYTVILNRTKVIFLGGVK
jgi:uncharacterized protein with gpF-like domain